MNRSKSLVVCSLEAWDEVWRRNQFLVDELLRRDHSLRVLFLEPPVDVTFELAKGRRPGAWGLRRVTRDGRLWALRPRKFLPRILARGATDRRLAATVLAAAGRLGLEDPLLWVNDATYAHLAERVSWPVVYDITDDWLSATATKRALKRLELADAALLARAEEVVAVSPSLVASRSTSRQVSLVPNAVDVTHLRRPRPRPQDLPPPPVAVYVGTQHEDRLDLDLCAATAAAIAPSALAFVGPNCLGRPATRALAAQGCVFLGARPYDEVPAYYQHADLVVVPHRVNPFTESLDPIKGYECIAVGRPTLTTPVGGMRDLGPPVEVREPGPYPARARELLAEEHPSQPGNPPSWSERAVAFAGVLDGARRARAKREQTAGPNPSI